MTDHGFGHHNHDTCISDALGSAEQYCADNKVKLTPVRRRVLEILLDEHKALGAYDILAILSKEGLGSQPPVAYRALDFLVSHGFAHRIENRNAYAACTFSGCDRSPTFLICTSCDNVVEAQTEASDIQIDGIAARAGFTISRAVIEIEGTCPNCTDAETT